MLMPKQRIEDGHMITLTGGNSKLEALLLQLPAGLRQHAAVVRDKALDLARTHSIDQAKTEVAALAHDLARAATEAELLTSARLYGLPIHPVEARVTVLLHGPVAAEVLRRECGIADEEVLEAVRWHSTFNRGLGPVAKLVFLADKLDPQKMSRYPFLERVDALAREDLNAALLLFLQEELASMIAAGRLVHPASVEGRNELLELRGGL
jgi:predicted HD superfamily hydrolase involved in NAD metabolism